jgi:hypothetical protein
MSVVRMETCGDFPDGPSSSINASDEDWWVFDQGYAESLLSPLQLDTPSNILQLAAAINSTDPMMQDMVTQLVVSGTQASQQKEREARFKDFKSIPSRVEIAINLEKFLSCDCLTTSVH